MENLQIIKAFDSSSSDDESLLDCFFPSSSSSSSDCDEINSRTSVHDYEGIITNYTDAEFQKHFRLKRSIVAELIDLYTEFMRQQSNVGRVPIGPSKEIYITLWYMANTETYRQISDRFDITKSSVFRVLHRVVEWIVSISSLYIKWPTEQETRANQNKFLKIKGFPRVVGAIDGCHIRINRPKENKEAFYNRKKYYSILLQAIVNADKKFIDIHCGELGSMHDA